MVLDVVYYDFPEKSLTLPRYCMIHPITLGVSSYYCVVVADEASMHRIACAFYV